MWKHLNPNWFLLWLVLGKFTAKLQKIRVNIFFFFFTIAMEFSHFEEVHAWKIYGSLSISLKFVLAETLLVTCKYNDVVTCCVFTCLWNRFTSDEQKNKKWDEHIVLWTDVSGSVMCDVTQMDLRTYITSIHPSIHRFVCLSDHKCQSTSPSVSTVKNSSSCK